MAKRNNEYDVDHEIVVIEDVANALDTISDDYATLTRVMQYIANRFGFVVEF